MRFQAHPIFARGESDPYSGDCQSRSFRCALNATDRDRQILLAVQARFERHLCWSRRSQTVGQVLGIAAVVAATAPAQPLARGILLAAAIIELGLVQWFLATARHQLRDIVALIARDVSSGKVCIGRGRLRSRLGKWQLIQDLRTGRLTYAPVSIVGLAGLRPGDFTRYRYASNSRIALSLDGQEQRHCEAISDEHCEAARTIGSCNPNVATCSPSLDGFRIICA